MKKPREIKGYDVLVWARRKHGAIFCCSYSGDGHRFLRSLDDGYTDGAIMEICAMPEEFIKQIPPKVVVGLVNPRTKKVFPIAGNRLQ